MTKSSVSDVGQVSPQGRNPMAVAAKTSGYAALTRPAEGVDEEFQKRWTGTYIFGNDTMSLVPVSIR